VTPSRGPARRGDSLSLTFAGEADALAGARDEVREYLTQQAVEEPVRYAVDLVLDELAGNVIRYGYDDDDREHEIHAALVLEPGRVLIRLTDDGRPYDPTLQPEPEPPTSIAAASIGGRGVSLVRRFARAMRYAREGGRNSLEVELARDAAE